MSKRELNENIRNTAKRLREMDQATAKAAQHTSKLLENLPRGRAFDEPVDVYARQYLRESIDALMEQVRLANIKGMEEKRLKKILKARIEQLPSERRERYLRLLNKIGRASCRERV